MIAAVHIVKSRQWHGHLEEFENVWHYDTPVITTEEGWADLVNAIVAKERAMHGTNVTFVRARVHGPTNTTQAEDIMRYVADLTGAGTHAATNVLPPEMACVASFYVGRSTRGYKIFLRKYLRLGQMPGGGTNDMALGIAPLNAAQRTELTNFMNDMKNIVVGANNNALCTPAGRHLPVGAPPIIADYTHTRQLKAGRRERRQL